MSTLLMMDTLNGFSAYLMTIMLVLALAWAISLHLKQEMDVVNLLATIGGTYLPRCTPGKIIRWQNKNQGT
jgi:hypothetical protein